MYSSPPIGVSSNSLIHSKSDSVVVSRLTCRSERAVSPVAAWNLEVHPAAVLVHSTNASQPASRSATCCAVATVLSSDVAHCDILSKARSGIWAPQSCSADLAAFEQPAHLLATCRATLSDPQESTVQG